MIAFGRVGQLGKQQQRRAGRAGRERFGGRLDLRQVHVQGYAGQRRAGRGEQGRGSEHAQDDRSRPGRHQAGQPRPRGQPAGGAQPARHQREQERRDDRLPERRRRLRTPARHRQGSGQQGVGQGEGEGGVADVPQPGDRTGVHHPPSGHGQQRAGQQDQPQREHADPPGAVDGDADMVRDQPQQGGGAQHPAEPGADAHVRGGDPADRGQRGQRGEPAGRRRARGDAARDDQRPRGPRLGPGPGGLRGGRGPRVVGLAAGGASAETLTNPILATGTAGPSRRAARRASGSPCRGPGRRSRWGSCPRGRRPSPALPSWPGRCPRNRR